MRYDSGVNQVVFVSEEFLIVFKDHETCTVPLKNSQGNNTLLDFVGGLYPEVLNVCGKNPWEGGAVHRLDTATAGLVVFARTQAFYDRISKYQNKGEFVKIYRAETDGNSKLDGKIASYFRAFGPGRKMVKAEVDVSKADSPVLYTTVVENKGNGVYECSITRGFRHQIRVHLSTEGCPIKGDKLYNPSSSESFMHLECIQVIWPGFKYRVQ